jgi:hypothetical protein
LAYFKIGPAAIVSYCMQADRFTIISFTSSCVFNLYANIVIAILLVMMQNGTGVDGSSAGCIDACILSVSKVQADAGYSFILMVFWYWPEAHIMRH